MITLAYPWLLALLPLPFLARWALPEHRESRQAVRVPFLRRLSELTGHEPGPGAVVRRRSRAQVGLIVIAWFGTVLALARPQWIEDPITRTIPSRDLLLAVDLSGSMETADFKDAAGETVDRLTAVKQVLDGFLSRREGDRVGLIFFGSAAFVQVPFTDDLEVCRELLEEAQVRMAGPRTVLGDAIGLALTVFDRSELKDRVLITLTDGNDTGSRVPPDQAAEIARDHGIVIYTVAVGDPQAAGEEKLDEETLRGIASKTGGKYFHAEDRVALESIYVELDKVETSELETLTHRPKHDLFHWPLAAAVVISLLFHTAAAISTAVRGRRREWSHA